MNRQTATIMECMRRAWRCRQGQEPGWEDEVWKEAVMERLRHGPGSSGSGALPWPAVLARPQWFAPTACAAGAAVVLAVHAGQRLAEAHALLAQWSLERVFSSSGGFFTIF